MIHHLLISAIMAVSPLQPKTPTPDVPKEYAVLNTEEERNTPSRRDRRANKRRSK